MQNGLENQPSDLPDGAAAPATLLKAIARARWAVLWERTWPPLAALATVGGVFLALSWLGLWLWLPPSLRVAALVIFGALALAALAPLLLVRFPSRSDALQRIDRMTGVPHRPATTIADRIATSANDPLSVALWRAHVERALATATALRSGVPRPRLALRDPLALRALVLVLVAATFVAAGDDRWKRVAGAFDWRGVMTPANFRLDAWISPPQYTGRPPIILQGLKPGESPVQSTAAISVPAGSVLLIRGSGNVSFDVAATGGIAETQEGASPTIPPGTAEKRYAISESGSVVVRGPASLTWQFNAIADKPPTIALVKQPEPQSRGGLLLTYKLEDDYGVVEAQATFALKNAEGARPLFAAPDFALALPQARTRNGVGQTTKDMTDHPLAGADVVMTLVARDEVKNEGRSEPVELKLPERIFTKPLARALIEQRRVLAVDAESRDRVLIAIDALAIAPETFNIESGTYLGLRSLYWDLARAKSDDDLRAVVASLWSMATQLEDSNVSDTEAALRQAQERLRQALERGAGDEELKRLMDELRAAMDKFLQALAEDMRKNPDRQTRIDPNARQLRSQDLKSLLDRLENMARSGSKDAARQLLDELSQMLNNLQMARPGDMDQGDDDMMSALDELGDMIRKQQQLRDRTFKQGQDQRRQRGQGKPGDRGDDMSELQQDQKALREQLKKLLDELAKKGVPLDNNGEFLGQAGDAMGDAENALGDKNADGAVGNQGRALDALRKGARGLAQAMQDQGIGPGPGRPGRNGPQRADQGTDPLGRPLRGRDTDNSTVKVPGEIDAQRSRRILEELRRRLAEPARPQIELDYIERLLKDF